MMKLILVGIKDDDGKIGHIRVFTNPTWSNKYAASAGEFAVFSEVEIDWKTTPPQVCEESSQTQTDN